MNIRVAVLAFLLTSSAFAARLSDYSQQWPVSATDEGAYALALDESIYRQLARNDLADLAAFNADGQVLAFGPMPASYSPPPSEWRKAAWFALPAATGMTTGGNDDLHLHVSRSSSGELSLDANLGGAKATPKAGDAVRSLLVDVLAKDLLAKDRTIEAITFETSPGAADFNVQVSIEASDDLEHWQTVVGSATVAQLHQGGSTLSRKLVEFLPLSTSYLRIRTLGYDQALPLQSLNLQTRPKGPQPRTPPRQWLAADFTGREGAAFTYRLPSRIPVEALDVMLADDNSVAEITLSMRDDEQSPWQYAGSINAFRLRGAGLSLENESLAISSARAGFWRISVVSGQEQASPPVLRFAFRPETWLLLTHGRPPYVIAAGSQRAQRPDFPLEMLVDQVRGKYGRDWQPAPAAIGAMRVAGGTAALRAYNPDQKRTWVLWGVLVLGALGVVVMVLKLVKTPPKDPPQL